MSTQGTIGVYELKALADEIDEAQKKLNACIGEIQGYASSTVTVLREAKIALKEVQQSLLIKAVTIASGPERVKEILSGADTSGADTADAGQEHSCEIISFTAHYNTEK